ncbi:hypothetical protein HYU16_00800 [Candidatus Woesearchaeota archaeon]|nr:hypothetical protein [Candidatus Woesearchaeota archaeon]
MGESKDEEGVSVNAASVGPAGSGAGLSSLRVSPKVLTVAAVAALFIVSLYLWTLPFRENRLPFGEGDSAWHFAIGDEISSSDKATFRLPYYVGVWYYGFNRILGPFALEYPPPNHVNYALMQFFGGERFIPVFIYRAVASFLGVFSVFFLLSRLFGVLPAFIAGLGLVFSFREQMIFLWGQQPTLVSLIIMPVVLYSWYSYLVSYYAAGERGERRVYLYLAFALLASQFMLHIQGFLASLLVLGIFTAVMAAKFRKLPVSRSNLVPFAAALVAFSAVVAPFAPIYLGAPSDVPPVSSVERLMQWNIPHNLVSGSFPEPFVLFSHEYAFPVRLFLFAGILLLIARAFLIRPNYRELMLVSWLAGLYIIFHLDVFGILDQGRVARMQVIEPALFFSLAALSVVWLPQTVSSILKLGARFVPAANAAKYILAAVLVLALLGGGWSSTQARLKGAYGGLERITPLQAEFAAGVLHSLPEKAFIYDPVLPNVGSFSYTTWRYPKMRWMLAISQRYVGRDFPDEFPHKIADPSEVYVLFDYSDLALLASSSDQGTKQLGLALANELQAVELRLFNNSIPLYDGNNMRLYKYPYERLTNSSISSSEAASA